jgi:hypothetical protein
MGKTYCFDQPHDLPIYVDFSVNRVPECRLSYMFARVVDFVTDDA